MNTLLSRLFSGFNAFYAANALVFCVLSGGAGLFLTALGCASFVLWMAMVLVPGKMTSSGMHRGTQLFITLSLFVAPLQALLCLLNARDFLYRYVCTGIVQDGQFVRVNAPWAGFAQLYFEATQLLAMPGFVLPVLFAFTVRWGMWRDAR